MLKITYSPPPWIRIDEAALKAWTREAKPDLPDYSHDEHPGVRFAALVQAALEYGVISGIPDDLSVLVNGDDDSDGAGFYVLLGLIADRRVLLTTGWSSLDSLLGALEIKTYEEGVRACVEALTVEIAAMLDAIGMLAVADQPVNTATLEASQSEQLQDEFTQMMWVADDGEAAVLDELRRRAGLTWEHFGCWTNMAADKQCGRCGRARSDIEVAGDTR